MSKKKRKKKHILPNGIKVKIKWEGKIVGEGILIDNDVEKEGRDKHIYYKVKIECSDLENMLGFPNEHWLNDFEVKPMIAH